MEHAGLESIYMKSEYIAQINIGIKQIENGEMITDDEFVKELATW